MKLLLNVVLSGRCFAWAGANYIPPDIFHSRATPEVLRDIVAEAAAAHMNMLRVWGGGMYPPDAFFDAADEMGVMIWQEGMFACALYPRDEPFLQEVHSLPSSLTLKMI
jgi:beta-mannosidase